MLPDASWLEQECRIDMIVVAGGRISLVPFDDRSTRLPREYGRAREEMLVALTWG